MSSQNDGRKVGREIAISLLLGAVLAAGFVAYLLRTIELPKGPVLVAEVDAGPPRPGDLDVAREVAGGLIAHVRAGRFDEAYALMARPYRARAGLQAFRNAWTSAPLLAGLRDVRLTSSRSEAARLPDGRLVAPATFTAGGALVVAVGSLNASFTFLREDGQARVLVLAVAGVPILDGVR